MHKGSHTARAVTQTDVTRSSYQPSYVAPDQLENRDSRCRPQHGKKIGTKHNLQVFIPGKNSSWGPPLSDSPPASGDQGRVPVTARPGVLSQRRRRG